jgi:hypothetical protein
LDTAICALRAWREKLSDVHFEDVNEIPNLRISRHASAGLDVGQDVPRHITAEHLQLRHQIVLRPTAAVTQLDDCRPYYVEVALQSVLR